MPLSLFQYIGVPVGDISVVHPNSGFANFQVTSVAGGVPAAGDLVIRHEIKNLVGDTTITTNYWNCMMMPVFSWMIKPLDFDLTLEIFINNGGFGIVDESWRTFLLPVGVPHTIDGLYIPAVFCEFVLHNSSTGAAAGVNGFLRMRSL